MEKIYLFIDETTDFPTEIVPFRNLDDAVKEMASRVGFYMMDYVKDNDKDGAAKTIKTMTVEESTYVDASGREKTYYSDVYMKDTTLDYKQYFHIEEAELN